MLTWISGVLLAAAATPMPVHVENWPGADKVAVDTLQYARWAFWATVLIGLPALVFAFVDYLLNMRQFRRPKLSVTLAPHANITMMTQQGSTFGRLRPYSHQDDNKHYEFFIPLHLKNSGKRAATGCYVAIWVPTTLGPTSGGWATIDRSDDGIARGLPRDTYQCHEIYIAEPVFVEHPISLPMLHLRSAAGPIEFDLYWQVFDESGKSERKQGTFLKLYVTS